MRDDAFVTVLWTTSWIEAEIASGALEAEGIPVDLKGESGEGPYPLTISCTPRGQCGATGPPDTATWPLTW
jgi:hypothetical protein